MDYVRTPDERFAHLTDFPLSPQYCDVDDQEGGRQPGDESSEQRSFVIAERARRASTALP